MGWRRGTVRWQRKIEVGRGKGRTYSSGRGEREGQEKEVEIGEDRKMTDVRRGGEK